MNSLQFSHPRLPGFVIELRSESDSLPELESKMKDWIANGARLAWLIDPDKGQVLVFRPGRTTEVVLGNQIAGVGPVASFTRDLTRVWKCFQD